MAESKGNTGTTRRGFMAAVGVGAAALAIPDVAGGTGTGARPRFAAGNWREAVRSWPAAVEAMKAHTEATVAAFRPAYLAEVRRLAEGNRGRFSPGGDLFAALRSDYENDAQAAKDRIEALCAERFGLEVEEDRISGPSGDAELGRMICAVSPSAPEWDVDGVEDGEWAHPCYAARACAGSDVLAIARAEGWGVRS